MDVGNNLTLVTGDLLDQDVDAIVNPWNRNLIPWWLLLPQGVSGAIKRRAGLAPFRELRRHGVLPLGSAVLTGAGRLQHRGIIHVAGINHLWRASETSIQLSVTNAVDVAVANGFGSIAFPTIGAGGGGFDPERAKAIIVDELERIGAPIRMVLVQFKKA